MPNVATSVTNETDAFEKPSATHTRLIRLSEVMHRVGLGRSAIYQRMKEGTFPKSRSLGSRCSVWIEAEVDDWIEAVKGL